MPFNLSNISQWINAVRGVATTDQVEGGPGGVANMGLQDLTSRTQWLFDRLGQTFVNGFTNIATGTSLTAADVGKGFVVTGAHAGSIPLPNLNDVQEGQGFLFVHQAGALDVPRIAAAGSQVISVSRNVYPFVGLKPCTHFFVLKAGTSWRLFGDDPRKDVGMIQMFPVDEDPEGWFVCDGRAINRLDYRDLFERIGTNYGAGNGSTTFNLPDLRGQFIRGLDAGRGIDPGRGMGTEQNQSVGNHRHITGAFNGDSDNNWNAIQISFNRGETYQGRTVVGEGSGNFFGSFTTPANRATGTSVAVDETSGDVRPRNTAFHYVIKF